MFRYSWIVMVLGVALVAHADSRLPHVFEEGAPARAEEVNENFRYLEERVEVLTGDRTDRVVYVDARPGHQNQKENGAALARALNRFGGASTDSRYLVILRPGIYDLEDETVLIRPFVTVKGAGSQATTLRSSARTAIMMNPGARLESLSILHGGDAEVTIEAKRTIVGGDNYLTDVHITMTGQGDVKALTAEDAISLFLRNVRIDARGNGEVVGIDAAGGGVVDAVDLTSRVRNDAPDGDSYALFLRKSGASKFFSSHFEASGEGGLPLRIAFSGRAHFIGSRFLHNGQTFAHVEGNLGKTYVGASEVGSGVFSRAGTAEIFCAQTFSREYEDRTCHNTIH